MEEVEHKISILEGAKQAMIEKNAPWLRDLSNKTIHSASTQQDAGSLITAVLIYSLSKLVERRDYIKIRNWDKLVDKLEEGFDCAIKAAIDNDDEEYGACLKEARKTLEEFSIDLKHYIHEVLRKAAINKASRVYEHGISLGQTANLLGLTTWELTEYAGQNKVADTKYNETMNVKARAKMAMEFFE